jgi:hypothetical protein
VLFLLEEVEEGGADFCGGGDFGGGHDGWEREAGKVAEEGAA